MARSATTSGRFCSAAWIVFFEAELQFLEGVPEVGNGRAQVQVAFEVFERGARLGRDLGPNPSAFTLSQRASFVGPGLRFQRLARVVKFLDGSDPSGAHVEYLGDLAAGQALVGERNHAVAELHGECFHRRTLLGCRNL
jgi:hypothetical protein